MDCSASLCGQGCYQFLADHRGDTLFPIDPNANHGSTVVMNAVFDPLSAGATMTLTEAHVAAATRVVPDLPPNPDRQVFNESDYGDAASDLLAAHGTDPLWLFAYGSLLWNPTLPDQNWRRATAKGWRRSFCMEMRSWRGTPDQPGLMLALRSGGTCTGLAQPVPAENRHDHLTRLLRREIDGPKALQSLRIVALDSDEGPLNALCFYADPIGRTEDRSATEVAAVLARACGPMGSCAEYLFKTVTALEHHGIRDPHLWELQHLVALELAAHVPPPAA